MGAIDPGSCETRQTCFVKSGVSWALDSITAEFLSLVLAAETVVGNEGLTIGQMGAEPEPAGASKSGGKSTKSRFLATADECDGDGLLPLLTSASSISIDTEGLMATLPTCDGLSLSPLRVGLLFPVLGGWTMRCG